MSRGMAVQFQPTPSRSKIIRERDTVGTKERRYVGNTHAVGALHGTPRLRFAVGDGARRSDRPEWVCAFESKEGADGFESEGDEEVRGGEALTMNGRHSLKGW